MRVGIALSTLRTEVLIEARLSTTAAHSSQHTERINHLLNRMERQLQDQYDWPLQRVYSDVSVAAEVQFKDIPHAFPSFTSIKEVRCAVGDQWLEVLYGIGIAERNTYSDDARSTPIQRWEMTGDNAYEFELWPISPQDEVLRFFATRYAGGEMELDADECILDGDVLVLETAAVLLDKSDKEAAAVLRSQSAARLQTLKIRQKGDKRPVPSMLGGRRYLPRPGIDYIASGGS